MHKYNFTLIIPTHNRHKYLRRSVAYFKSIDCDVIYCDSSSVSYDGLFAPNMKYLHLPESAFADKILIALEYVATDFVALCADDDFIMFNALYKGVDILQQSIGFKTIIGCNIAFHEKFDNNFYFKDKPVLGEINYKPSKNSKIFFNNYQQILWGLYDRRIVEKSFTIVKEAVFKNDNFIELVLGGIACYVGGIKVLEEVWSVRELNSQLHWGDKHKSITTSFFDQGNKKDFMKFKLHLDALTEKGYSKLVLKSYMNLSVIVNIKNLLKSFIRTVTLNKFPRACSVQNSNYIDSFDKYPGLNIFNISGEEEYGLMKISEVIKKSYE